MIRIENLSVAFDKTEVVKNVSLDLVDGEVLGVVGESGSGKSVTALTLMGLVSESAQITSGRILFDDVVLQEAGKPRDQVLYRRYQGAQMSMIFQEPMTSLNPTQRVGHQVEEMLWLHAEHRPQGPWKQASDALRLSGRRTGQKEEFRTRVLEAFHAVGLRDEERVYTSYPHQLSGGMRQRVMIAMALILHPRLLVADEPTTALDVTVQNQIIALLRKINSKQNNAMLFITHDLNLARRLCGRIAVMKDGRVVELGETEEIFRHPRQEYTKRLIEAVPSRMKKKTWSADAVLGKAASAEAALNNSAPVVRVHDLSVFYQDGSNSLFGQKKKQCVVADASFEIYPGESLGLVGESGCGKTSLSKAILGMNRSIRGEIVSNTTRPQMVFQDPYSSLNPAKTIGWLLQEPLRAAGALDRSKVMTKADMEAAAYDMLHRVGMEDKYFHRKPSQLSGGQRQRVSIGQALITHPGLVVADEPVSALDVTIQAQIMELMRRLQQEMKLAYLFISHDINVVYQMCDRIMVMKEGRIIEVGETERLFRAPKEEYTRELLSSS
ncbi:MAG: ABC transporter ATP-binding protein [Lachnospiraceae bacterium]|nr:ABC transporter ATP-binding protein [Lachnospiraceae bacterium]